MGKQSEVRQDVELSELGQYYTAKVDCWNCRRTVGRYIKKGTSLNNARTACDNCGCMVRMSGGK